jgi:hypothetical protein
MASAARIVRSVEWQCSNYHYTFPKAPMVSVRHLFSHNHLTFSQGIGSNSLAMRSRPYRNSRIINVIHSLCFTGGSTSFITRFGKDFPSVPGGDGVSVREIPISIVALVATAVSTLFSMHINMLTRINSFMHQYMSGVLARIKLWSFQPVPFTMCIKAMLVHFNMFGIIEVMRSIQ